MTRSFAGLLVPALTPFDASLAPDTGRFVALCRQLLNRGADGLAVFGTTGEANSMDASERRSLLDALREANVPGDRLMPGVGSCSISETSELLNHAGKAEAAGALLLPPFFYKGAAASDDGLFDFVAAVIRRTEAVSTRIYLYHIPPVAQVGWSLSLIKRLVDAFPERIVGLKDSSGDWAHTQRLLSSFPDLEIFPGSEVFLLSGLRGGGAGCITATGNINPTGIRAILDAQDSDRADRLQTEATRIRTAVEAAGNPIAVMKAYLALKTGDPAWRHVRPPLRAVDQETAASLDAALTATGFEFDVL